MLAFGKGLVVFASGGYVRGFSEATGKLIWSAGRGGIPVYAGGVFAYADSDGSVHAVDVRSGATKWRFVLPAKPYRSPLPARFAHVLWSAGSSFLVSRVVDGSDSGSTWRGPMVNYGELSAAGKLDWTAPLDGQFMPPVVAWPYVVQRYVPHLDTFVSALRLGPRGGVSAKLASADDVNDVRPPHVVLSGGPRYGTEPQDQVLTRELNSFDLRDGSLGWSYLYAPDYNENYTRFYRKNITNLCTGECSWHPIGIEGRMVYLAIYGARVYRYRLGPVSSQRPLLVSDEGTYVGGPYHGAIYVARSDGVWMIRPRERSIESTLVAPSTAAFGVIVISGQAAYVSFADGSIHGFNVDGGDAVLEAKTCPASRLAVGPTMLYAVCAIDKEHWRVVAFRRS
jgi:hypothetical protein